MENFKGWEDLHLVRTRIDHAIHRTPVLTSETLNKDAGAKLFFKCENFQKTGSFKARGAANFVFSLSQEEAAKGVATHSSGNHGAALARAAALRGITAHIIMPNNSPATKQETVRRYGGKLTLCDPTYEARKLACAKIIQETGATLAHSADDYRIIGGQGTTGLEFTEQVPDLDLILAPIGGGGMASGLVVAMKTLNLRTEVIAVEPEQADDAFQSWKTGVLQPPEPNTVADGLRTGLAEQPFRILQAGASEIVTVSEAAIVAAMQRIWKVLKIVVEPSAAVPYAAILEGKITVQNRRIGVVLTGGNLDLTKLPWVTQLV